MDNVSVHIERAARTCTHAGIFLRESTWRCVTGYRVQDKFRFPARSCACFFWTLGSTALAPLTWAFLIFLDGRCVTQVQHENNCCRRFVCLLRVMLLYCTCIPTNYRDNLACGRAIYSSNDVIFTHCSLMTTQVLRVRHDQEAYSLLRVGGA